MASSLVHPLGKSYKSAVNKLILLETIQSKQFQKDTIKVQLQTQQQVKLGFFG
jgi:hypothetical protein